jgi:hypothetical protein
VVAILVVIGFERSQLGRTAPAEGGGE